MPQNQRLPQSTPIRCFAAGTEVSREAIPAPDPAWEMAHVEIQHRPAPEPEEVVRLHITRYFVHGQPQPLPPTPLNTSPPEVPTESPVRIIVRGEPFTPPPPAPEPEESPGEAQLWQEREARAVWLDRAMSGQYVPPDEWKQLQARENRYGDRLSHRVSKRRLYITDDEQVLGRRR